MGKEFKFLLPIKTKDGFVKTRAIEKENVGDEEMLEEEKEEDKEVDEDEKSDTDSLDLELKEVIVIYFIFLILLFHLLHI